MSSNPVDDLFNHPGISIGTTLASCLNSEFNKLEHTRLLNIFPHREKLIEKFVDIQLSTDSDVLVNPLELKRKFNEAVDARVALYQQYCTWYNQMAGQVTEAYRHKENTLKALVNIYYQKPAMTYGQQMQLMIAKSDWKVVDRYLGLPFGDTEEIWNRSENMKAQLFRDIMAARAARRFPLTKPAEDRKKAVELVDREPCLSALGKEVTKEKMSKDSGKTFMEW